MRIMEWHGRIEPENALTVVVVVVFDMRGEILRKQQAARNMGRRHWPLEPPSRDEGDCGVRRVALALALLM